MELRAVLDDELWHSYQQRLEQSRWEREMAATGSEIFAEYNSKLRVANMLYGRCEQLSARNSRNTLKFSNRIDGFYEGVVETLQETLHADPSAQAYIEAGYSDDPDLNTISFCPDGMPRMIYRASMIATRDECKIAVLTEAIAAADNQYGIGEYDLRTGTVLTAEVQAARLNQKRIELLENTNKSKSISPAFAKFFGE